MTARAMTRQMVTRPNAAMAASAVALEARASRAAIMIARRLARSAMAPPSSPSTKVGALPTKLTVPSQEAFRVRS